MTPAINSLKKAKIPCQVHTYDHDPGTTAFGEEVVEKLGLPPQRVFKTLVVHTETGNLVVAVVPVAGQLDLKQLARVVNAKKVKMADPKEVERTTGYLVGGVSPVGQKKRLKTVLDESAFDFKSLYVSGGKRGVQIELSPHDLAKATAAVIGEIGK